MCLNSYDFKSSTGADSFSGKLGSYSGSGYVVDLDATQPIETIAKVKELQVALIYSWYMLIIHNGYRQRDGRTTWLVQCLSKSICTMLILIAGRQCGYCLKCRSLVVLEPMLIMVSSRCSGISLLITGEIPNVLWQICKRYGLLYFVLWVLFHGFDVELSLCSS